MVGVSRNLGSRGSARGVCDVDVSTSSFQHVVVRSLTELSWRCSISAGNGTPRLLASVRGHLLRPPSKTWAVVPPLHHPPTALPIAPSLSLFATFSAKRSRISRNAASVWRGLFAFHPAEIALGSMV